MTSVCFYFQVHQPFRLNHFSIFTKGQDLFNLYFNDKKNQEIFEKIARKCYYPTNSLLYELIQEHDGKFRVSFSLTGVFLDQCERYDPGVIDSFKKLVDTGCVDLLSETYYHSLSSLISLEEFEEQIKLHQKRIKQLFGYKPTVFRNTEGIYNNNIAKFVEDLGYKGIMAEGASQSLSWKSPNYLHRPVGCSKIKLMTRNYQLSDDISFRFSERSWKEWPLTSGKYASWLALAHGDVINLFMDYETFGEHQWKETGIFEFLKELPGQVLRYQNLDFMTTKEVVEKYPVHGEVDCPFLTSWADVDRDLTAWLGNEMQMTCFEKLKRLESVVKGTGEKEKHIWRLLQTSDLLYYLCTKWFNDGDVHKYFNAFDSPYEAFISYMNILNHFEYTLKGEETEKTINITRNK